MCSVCLVRVSVDVYVTLCVLCMWVCVRVLACVHGCFLFARIRLWACMRVVYVYGSCLFVFVRMSEF